MTKQSRTFNGDALVEFLRVSGLDFSSSAHSWVLDCPLCGKHKWAIRRSDGYSKCYRCDHDFRGFADKTLAQATGKPRQELSQLFYGVVVDMAAEVVSDWVDHWGEWSSDEESYDDVWVWPAEMASSPFHYDMDHAVSAPGLEYVLSRGVTPEMIIKYGIRYDPSQSRVVLPVTIEGVLRGWQARAIKPGAQPKMLTAGALGGKCLMFQDNLESSGHGIMTEGPFDALMCESCGGNTATMGKNISNLQLDIYVQRYGVRKLYVGLDDDAVENVMRVAREMTWYEDVEIYKMDPAPGREDLGAGSLDENLEQFKSAKPLSSTQMFTFLWNDRFDRTGT